MPDNRKKRQIGGKYGTWKIWIETIPKECLEGPKVVWAMMYFDVLMVLRYHLEICQKYTPVRIIGHLGLESQISQILT